MGQRDAGIRGDPIRRGHTRHDLERDPVVGERFEFLAAAAEDERVTALQAHDTFAFAGEPDEQRADAILRQRVAVAFLADVDELGARSRQRNDFRRHQPVVNDRVGTLDHSQRAQRQQFGVARTSADERDAA